MQSISCITGPLSCFRTRRETHCGRPRLEPFKPLAPPCYSHAGTSRLRKSTFGKECGCKVKIVHHLPGQLSTSFLPHFCPIWANCIFDSKRSLASIGSVSESLIVLSDRLANHVDPAAHHLPKLVTSFLRSCRLTAVNWIRPPASRNHYPAGSGYWLLVRVSSWQ